MIREEQWPVGEHSTVEVNVPVGVVEVHVGDAGIIQVALDSSSAAEFEISKTGDRVVVRHPSRWSIRGRSCRVNVTVPAGTDVLVEAASADVRLSGRMGHVRIRTASGGVETDDATRLEISTASGDITGGAVDGNVSVSSVSGDCTLRTVGGSIDATLTSGELRVDRCTGDISVRSTSGDTRVGHCDGSDISVRTISGDVRMGLPSGIRVEADITTVSGKASMPEPAAPSVAERRPVRVKLKTVSGDIRIVRSV
ncbi:MAG TPA: DUF4097 family beta strand repeat-containing protein [Ilumatobacteraceae bacterium]|nr:DUF4097 family beta strand repeat-containing protein [Ilumatobacteraceae bacterium]HRB05220.1 DUF4097 family beta strand repeat-containing protein [Ilumatobacteraceae bacterium]